MSPICHPQVLSKLQGLLTLVVLEIAAGFWLSGCATPEFARPGLVPFVSRGFTQEVDGFSLTITPLTETTDVQNVFAADLMGNNIFAVYVAVTNRSSSSSFLISSDQFTLANGGTRASGGQVKQGRSTADSEAMMWTGVFVAMPLGIAGAIRATDTHAINQNFRHLELPRKSLSPGSSAEGFVYFGIPKRNARQPAWEIRFNTRELGSESQKEVKVPFQWNEP